MIENIDTKQLLEWYITAGVDATLGDEPFGLAKIAAAAAPAAVPKLSAELRRNTDTLLRQATTELAQDTKDACFNAREICSQAQTLEDLRSAVEKFDGCALKFTASHTILGEGCPTARIVFVGEAPGADEDRIGRPFVGRSGQLLDKMLKAVGLDRSICYITNVLPWRPPGNRTPTDAEIAVCLPFLKRQIDLINPDYLFVLGGSAANALLNQAESISRLRGRWLEYKNASGKTIQVLASFHPAYLLRNPAQKAKLWVDLLRLIKKNTQ